MPTSGTPESSPVFSFTLNAEVLNFLGGSFEPEDNCLTPSSALSKSLPLCSTVRPPSFRTLFFQLPTPDSTRSKIISTIQYSAVTTGIVVCVGLGSYCAYSCLQRLRNFDFRELWNSRTIIRDFLTGKLSLNFWKRESSSNSSEASDSRSRSSPDGITVSTTAQRLSELFRFRTPRQKSQLEMNGNSYTNLSTNPFRKVSFELDPGHILTGGEENGEDIQTEYFGPALEKNEQGLKLQDICALGELFRESPKSPDSSKFHDRTEL